MPQLQPQIPNKISTRGVGRGTVSVGSSSHYGYRDQEDPMDAKLRRLALLDQMDQSEQASNSGRLGDLAKTMTEITGIQDKMDLTPAQLKLLEAHANYYGQLGEDRPEERNARSMQLELSGLDKAYGFDPQNPEYHNARRSVLSKYGYNLDAATPTGPKPQGEFGAGGTPKSVNTAPSKFASLGSALKEDYTGARNAVGVPIYNAIAGLFGGEKAQPRPMPSNVPADYSFWFPQLRKQQPQPTLESQ